MDIAKKKTGPPKFQHLPKERAKKLKSAWIQTHKIKSKWNAERRRQGNHTESSSTAPEPEATVSNIPGILTEQKLDHQPHPIGPDTGSDERPSESEERPVKVSNPQAAREPARTANTRRSSQQQDRRPGRSSGHQGKRPSMRNRMNALLEKIQRDIN